MENNVLANINNGMDIYRRNKPNSIVLTKKKSQY